jgi:hypothetical protein
MHLLTMGISMVILFIAHSPFWIAGQAPERAGWNVAARLAGKGGGRPVTQDI